MSGTVIIASRLPHAVRLARDVVVVGMDIFRGDPPAWPLSAALTRVPAAIWLAWYSKHCGEPLVRNGSIWLAEDETEPPEAA